MSLRTTLTLCLAVTAAPALAGPAAGTARVDPARCHVQNVHTPAGKMIHSRPIVHCPEDRQVAQRDPAPAATATRVARD